MSQITLERVDSAITQEAIDKRSCNFEVIGLGFGKYKRGDVIPGFETVAADVNLIIANGGLRPTLKPVTVTVFPPKEADTADLAMTTAITEANSLRQKNAELTETNKTLVAREAEAQRQTDAFKRELHEKVSLVDTLRTQLEDDKAKTAATVAEKDELISRNRVLLQELDEIKAELAKAKAPEPKPTAKP